MSALPALILAAGASTRMRGRDKLLEPVGNQPLLAHVLDTARAFPRYVVLPADDSARRAIVDRAGATALPVDAGAPEMAASIRAGIAALPGDAPGVMILLADMPDLTAEDLTTLAATFGQHGGQRIVRAASENGKPGHPVIFPRTAFAALAGLTGDSGARQIISRKSDQVILVRLPGNRALTDLDTPEDWAAWRTDQNR